MRRAEAKTRLQALATFGPEFRDANASAGRWAVQTGSGTMDDPLTMPAFQYSELINRFVDMAYRVGWITNFDWMDWSNGPEGERFLQDKASLSNATVDNLSDIITAIVRVDRFSEGALAKSFNSGYVRALAERAEALLAE